VAKPFTADRIAELVRDIKLRFYPQITQKTLIVSTSA
jgi:hypothetical protein